MTIDHANRLEVCMARTLALRRGDFWLKLGAATAVLAVAR